MPVFVTVRPTGDWGVLPTSESIEASGLVTIIQIPNCYPGGHRVTVMTAAVLHNPASIPRFYDLAFVKKKH
eukprot:scaffold20823_cov130-Skeletonema_marinoi.AAC.1